MRKILFVVALAVSAVGVQSIRAEAGCGGEPAPHMPKEPPPPKSAGLQIPFVAPIKGQTATVIDEEGMKGTIKMGAKSTPMNQSLRQSYTTQVVSVGDDAITKETVTFTAAHMTVDAMGQKQDTDLPVKGKAYVIASTDGKPTYTTDAGAAVTDAEKAILGKLGENVGTADKMAKLLSAKTFVKSEKVTLSGDELAAMMGSTDTMTASNVTLTLTASDAKTATFTLAGTIGGKQSGLDMTIDFTATAKVDVKASRPLDFKMTGKLKGGGDAGGQKIEMTGTVTAHKVISYK